MQDLFITNTILNAKPLSDRWDLQLAITATIVLMPDVIGRDFFVASIQLLCHTWMCGAAYSTTIMQLEDFVFAGVFSC